MRDPARKDALWENLLHSKFLATGIMLEETGTRYTAFRPFHFHMFPSTFSLPCTGNTSQVQLHQITLYQGEMRPSHRTRIVQCCRPRQDHSWSRSSGPLWPLSYAFQHAGTLGRQGLDFRTTSSALESLAAIYTPEPGYFP